MISSFESSFEQSESAICPRFLKSFGQSTSLQDVKRRGFEETELNSTKSLSSSEELQEQSKTFQDVGFERTNSIKINLVFWRASSNQKVLSEEESALILWTGATKPPFRANNTCSLISHLWTGKVAKFAKLFQTDIALSYVASVGEDHNWGEFNKLPNKAGSVRPEFNLSHFQKCS